MQKGRSCAILYREISFHHHTFLRKDKLMKKITALFLALVTLLGMLASCGGKNDDGTVGSTNVKFTDIYKSEIKPSSNSGYTDAEEIVLPESATEVSSEGGFLRYIDGGKLHFFSLKENRAVLSLDTSTSKADVSGSYIKVTDADMTHIYSNTGVKLVSVEGDAPFSSGTNGFTLEDRYYSVKDGAVKKSYLVPPFLSTSSLTFTEHYAIQKTNTHIIYYNDAFEQVAVYALPATATESRKFKLENDKFFIMYYLPLDSTSSDYDVFEQEENKKYSLHYELFDPEKGKASELDLDIRVYNIESADRYDMFKDEDQYIVSYYAIVDGIIDTSVTYYALIDENGKIEKSLSHFVEGQKGLIRPLNNDYYYVETIEGYAILDTEGNLVKRTLVIGVPAAYGYYHNYKIYGVDFSLLRELSYETVIASTYDYVLYTKTIGEEEHFYRYDKTGEHEILPPDGCTLYNVSSQAEGFYYISYLDSHYIRYGCYSATGKLLFTASDVYSISTLATGTDYRVIRYKNTDNKTVYLRLTK